MPTVQTLIGFLRLAQDRGGNVEVYAAIRAAEHVYSGDALLDIQRRLLHLIDAINAGHREDADRQTHYLLQQLGVAARLYAAAGTTGGLDATPPANPFDAVAATALGRSYRDRGTPAETLRAGFVPLFVAAITDELPDAPAALLAEKRAAHRDVVDEAEELIEWQYGGGERPPLSVLAGQMADSTLYAAPLPAGPVPWGYFAACGEIVYAAGLSLRHTRPALAAELAAEATTGGTR